MRSTKSPSWIRRALGFDPVPGPPHAFSLSEGSIRYAAFPRDGGGEEMAEFHQVELPPETFGSGVLGPTLQEERSLRAALEDLLSRLSQTPAEASLVLPDPWLRIVFTEIDELPRDPAEREEILRWKLKRLVPFRVDELRLRAVEVAPLPDQEEARRLMLAFAARTLLTHLEASFSSYGIRIGRLTNTSLSLLEAILASSGAVGARTLVNVGGEGYTLLVATDGVPALYRHKPFSAGADAVTLERMVRRELRLTRTFAEGLLTGAPPEVFLVAPAEVEPDWSRWLVEEFGGPSIRSAGELVAGSADAAAVAPDHVAPLLGAARTLVA